MALLVRTWPPSMTETPRPIRSSGRRVCVGDCGKTIRKNGAMECSNIGARKGTYDAVKLEKGEKSRAVRSYADVTREDVHAPLG